VFAGELRAETKDEPATAGGYGRIRVRVLDLRSRDGGLILMLFNSKEGFPGKEKLAARTATIPASAEAPVYVFEKVPFGTYAVSVRHDENGNGKLDTNFIGMPKEGVGTSNNPRSRFGPPSFRDAVFELDREELELPVHLRYL
jgi:uncharacterized protein (DUF2141 family)